jgi:hypothetical protein
MLVIYSQPEPTPSRGRFVPSPQITYLIWQLWLCWAYLFRHCLSCLIPTANKFVRQREFLWATISMAWLLQALRRDFDQFSKVSYVQYGVKVFVDIRSYYKAKRRALIFFAECLRHSTDLYMLGKTFTECYSRQIFYRQKVFCRVHTR